jgi:RND family efflux transporter MFP subunit
VLGFRSFVQALPEEFAMRAVLVVSISLVLALGAIACGGSGTSASSPAAAATSTIVQLAPEQVAQATLAEISTGPVVSGELTPAREATIRAQVGGSIVSLAVDRGQPVTAGQEIARIASRDLEAAMGSAESAVKSAEAALSMARTEAERTRSLVAGGALAARDLEQAQTAVAAAEAQVAAARARQRSVSQQLEDTSVKAPFAGLISARPASVGDVVAPGSELFTIIDPSSLRLEAQVPSDQIAEVRAGAPVRFHIRGVPGDFVGRVDRLSAVADPVTRQVSIFVSIPNTGGRLIAGLFAEGRVETATHRGVIVPLAAVDESGLGPQVTVIDGGKAQRRSVTLGMRQGDTERVEIVEGVRAGETLVLGSARGVADGTPVNVVR